MVKKTIFPIKHSKIKIVNRCIMCGKVIPMGLAICNTCNLKRLKALKRR